ncbi:ComF family protein [Aureibacillus halotolerans]|uniref:Competence protein ComFC n=1 Tax=Aureibacillus halotolerans TaxID=1508390 RepID=A0A4R6TYC8_9BACI|nr:phosphoribosyltransferase family protein [Aureibacillus halotolerans]TDQ36925.1 competence protein ComFC [Aureibacillus halotolerans]
MRQCGFCEKRGNALLDWSWWWSATPSLLCEDCQSSFEKVTAGCIRCAKAINEVGVCLECQDWERHYPNLLERNVSLYRYNAFMKSYLSQWKFSGDYVLGQLFVSQWRDFFHRQFPQAEAIAPIPLTEERRKQRKFNQAYQLAALLEVPKIIESERYKEGQQSAKGRVERLDMDDGSWVKLLSANLPKSIVIIDDVYTTGATVHQFAKTLRGAGVLEVASCTLIRA